MHVHMSLSIGLCGPQLAVALRRPWELQLWYANYGFAVSHPPIIKLDVG